MIFFFLQLFSRHFISRLVQPSGSALFDNRKRFTVSSNNAFEELCCEHQLLWAPKLPENERPTTFQQSDNIYNIIFQTDNIIYLHPDYLQYFNLALHKSLG